MALFYNLYDSDLHNEHEWHVGRSTKQMNEYGRQCIALQADGDELEAIRSQFTNLPIHTTRRVQRWSGDFAAFIAMNLTENIVE